MFKCPSCEYTSEVEGICPNDNSALVEQPAEEQSSETPTETPVE